MDFLNMYPWQPNGYFSAADEQALAGTERRTPYWASDPYAQMAAYLGWDVGDEIFGGDAYAYVGGSLETQKQLRASIISELHQVTESDPQHENGPGIGELVSSLYAGVANIWKGLASSYASDWSQG